MVWALAALSALPLAAQQEPSADWSVSDVVGIQLNALKENNNPYPNAGIETVFRFATIRNQRSTGPLPRFIQMVHVGYGDLLELQSFDLSEPLIEGNEALLPVNLTTATGSPRRYIFYLRRSMDLECPGCWRTDAVLPAEGQEAGEPFGPTGNSGAI